MLLMIKLLMLSVVAVDDRVVGGGAIAVSASVIWTVVDVVNAVFRVAGVVDVIAVNVVHVVVVAVVAVFVVVVYEFVCVCCCRLRCS